MHDTRRRAARGTTAARRTRAIHTTRAMLTLAALVVAHPVAAQRIESLTLPPAVETHPHEFTGITSLRELSDGRVIVTDGAEQRILVLDFANQTAKEIGREGQGPEEYGLVHFVYDIGADSSFMVDMPGMRFLLFNGDSIVETVPPDDPAAEASGGVITGADRLGHIIQWRTPRGAPGVTITGKDDSSTVVRISRATGRVDTLATLRLAAIRTERTTNSEGRTTSVFSRPVGYLPSKEEAVLLPDGTLAVARLEPFRVDLRSPDGTWLYGDSLPVPPIRTDRRERKAFMERNSVPRESSGTPSPFPEPELSADDFPDYIPPFNFGTKPLAGPDGTILIKRARSADYMQSHYFVIDRNARLLGQITLPANEEIVGAGEQTIYIAYKDEVDIERIRRHTWTVTRGDRD